MPRLDRLAAGISAAFVIASPASVFACDGNNPKQYASAKTVWCIDPTVWAQHQNELKTGFD